MYSIARSIVGPSLYAHFPVIRLELDLGELEQWPTATPRRTASSTACSPRCPASPSTAARSASRAASSAACAKDEGTWLGHVLEHVAIELQNLAGDDVTFGKTRSAGAPGVYYVVYEYEEERRRALPPANSRSRCSTRCCRPSCARAAACRTTSTSAAERDELIRFAQRRALGPSTASLVRAAEARDIPWLRLNDQSLVQLGHGKYQKRIQATVTSETPHIAVELASDKEETNKILGDRSACRCRGSDWCAPTDGALRAARRLGFPVVVKPLDANHGRGVSIRPA